MFWSISLTAQTHNLPSPQMATEDDDVGPPPPGLVVSIDPGIPMVMMAGIVLGIYFLRKDKPTDLTL